MKTAVIPAVLAAGITLSPIAHADPPCNNQACLDRGWSEAGAPFVGSWGAHKEGVTINPDRLRTEITERGTMTFTLGSVVESHQGSGVRDTATATSGPVSLSAVPT